MLKSFYLLSSARLGETFIRAAATRFKSLARYHHHQSALAPTWLRAAGCFERQMKVRRLILRISTTQRTACTGVSRNGTQNAALSTSESDFAPTTNSPVADGFAKTDGSDDLFSKTTSSRAYIGVFEEVPSDPSAHQALAVE